MVVSESVRVRVAALVAFVLAALVLPALAAAQETGAAPGRERWEPARLRRVIEERYRVVPLRDGVALVPRRESRDVKSIEISGETVAINGAPVTGAEVRERLKSDADAILALSYLDPADRLALFGEGRPSTNTGRTGSTAAPSESPSPSPTASSTRSITIRCSRRPSVSFSPTT